MCHQQQFVIHSILSTDTHREPNEKITVEILSNLEW